MLVREPTLELSKTDNNPKETDIMARISNLALAIDSVDTTTGEVFIGDQTLKVDQNSLLNLVRSQLGPVAVQQAPASPRRSRPAAASESETRRKPGRPAKAAAEPAMEKRRPGRPKKLVDAKVVKKGAAKGTDANGSHMSSVWAARGVRAQKGLCIFCTDNTKAMKGSKFCKTHFEAKYPGKPLPTGQ